VGKSTLAWEAQEAESSPLRMAASAGAEVGIGSTHKSLPLHTKLDDAPWSARLGGRVHAQLRCRAAWQPRWLLGATVCPRENARTRERG
jgi:hypothetical protein